MPYKLFRQGEKFCVKNSETGESKGCSNSRAMAVKHMRALYAAEGGAKMGKKEIIAMVEKGVQEYIAENPDETIDMFKEGLEMEEKGYVPYGVMSFSDLDKYRQAMEIAHKTYSLTDDFHNLVWCVMESPDVEDKATAIKALADEFASRVQSLESEEGEDEGEYDKEIELIDEIDGEGNVISEDKAKRQDVSEADKKRAVAEYGNVKYADPANKKYPIDSEKHIRAAWSYINMPKNAAKYGDKGASIKRKVVAAWRRVIDKNGPPQAKKEKFDEGLPGALTKAFYSFADQLKSLFQKDEPEPVQNDTSPFMTYKDQSGKLHWLVTYSNNFRDDDQPKAEIIAEKSHRRFVELVDNGQAPMPELWTWHVPEWKFGQATWVAYDDKGFSVAGGDIDPGCEAYAEHLEKCKGIRLSHGMPKTSLRRDPENPTIILEHITKEISVLPDFAAANKYTGFVLLKSQDEQMEEDMAIPKNKIDALITQWGDGVKAHLDQLVKMNETNADQAAKEGRDTKSRDEAENVSIADATQTVNTDMSSSSTAGTPVVTSADVAASTANVTITTGATNVTNPPPDEEQAEGTGLDYATTEEIAEAFAKTVKPYVESLEEVKGSLAKLAEALEAVTKEVVKLKQSKEDAIKEVVSQTPAASVAAMIARNLVASSSPETTVDGRSTLGKAKPAESSVPPRFGIEFIDKMVSQTPESE